MNKGNRAARGGDRKTYVIVAALMLVSGGFGFVLGMSGDAIAPDATVSAEPSLAAPPPEPIEPADAAQDTAQSAKAPTPAPAVVEADPAKTAAPQADGSVNLARLPRHARSLLRAFLDSGEYAGAFAVGRDGDFGWVSFYGDRDLAGADALARCGGRENGCIIVAELSQPPGVAPKPAREELISLWSKDGFRAFYLGGRGGTGWSQMKVGPDIALARAHSNCLRAEAERRRAGEQRSTCRLVWKSW
ncbi:hypothetical protein [Mesobacterium pallidum]|uniref:hypothetical protein n=1 Tax=Mesobacterium pallidum TaxID=2872037 RepID=UPI001EE36FD9|nr:hypothetical protein [Mesobacterium pallidum]